MLPKNFAPWQSVYYYFCKWKNEGVIEELLDIIRAKVRKISGREDSPSLGIIDSRSVNRGNLADWVLQKFGWTLDVVLRPDECPTKFKVLPKRWIVERTFSWLENFRRLTIDYEFKADTAEALVQLACCKLMLNKIIG